MEKGKIASTGSKTHTHTNRYIHTYTRTYVLPTYVLTHTHKHTHTCTNTYRQKKKQAERPRHRQGKRHNLVNGQTYIQQTHTHTHRGRSVDRQFMARNNRRVPSTKWQAKMGNCDAIKYLDRQRKGEVASQNILGLPEQIPMALRFFSLFHALN